MTGAAFIHVATTWAAQNNGEPTWRSSISRAYYGAMHHCQEFVEGDLKIVKKQQVNVHDCIPEILLKAGNTELTTVADQLSELRRRRNKADYFISNPKNGTQELARTWAATGKDIEATINRVKTSADLRKIQHAIRPHLGQGLLTDWEVTVNL